MIADDDDPVRDARVDERSPHDSVEAVGSGGQALDVLAAQQSDVILSDLEVLDHDAPGPAAFDAELAATRTPIELSEVRVRRAMSAEASPREVPLRDGHASAVRDRQRPFAMREAYLDSKLERTWVEARWAVAPRAHDHDRTTRCSARLARRPRRSGRADRRERAGSKAPARGLRRLSGARCDVGAARRRRRCRRDGAAHGAIPGRVTRHPGARRHRLTSSAASGARYSRNTPGTLRRPQRQRPRCRSQRRLGGAAEQVRAEARYSRNHAGTAQQPCSARQPPSAQGTDLRAPRRKTDLRPARARRAAAGNPAEPWPWTRPGLAWTRPVHG